MNKIAFGQAPAPTTDLLAPLTLEDIKRPPLTSVPAVTVNNDAFTPSQKAEQPHKSNTWKWVVGLAATALAAFGISKHMNSNVIEEAAKEVQAAVKP